ncbi:TetR family transcriptional regulator protein [Hyella patelloides LEGE 07179]|uniref:TetR family transcriptional regulator protein n=1 Tax=Hyella patelloides LEGE 07179 TaxID=945734 RepID=A0A563VN05_9CYAN|nr:TetR/AcrR family transcriptional regulator [Hyella patelloides]VEP12819.1 TetR family transcriptional regulator protein [Hyella patelloides LEGE 07179]
MSKEEALIKLIPAFRQYGYEGATLSLLSKASGLGKASLYHYFPGGKSEMAAAVFEYVGDFFSDLVLKTLQGEEEPKSKIQAMCRSLEEFYDRGRNSCFLAIMSFGEADNLFHEQVKTKLQGMIETLAQVLIDGGIEPEIAEMRSQDAIAEIQGALILVRILDETKAFDRIIKNLPEKLLG